MLQMFFVIWFTFFTAAHSVEVIEDDFQIITTRSWNEFEGDLQRSLICHFDAMLTNDLKRLGIPAFWNDAAKSALLGDQDKYNTIVAGAHDQAQTYTNNQKITLDDLLPVGFLLGFGVEGSSTLIAGMGGTAMLTLVVVPVEISIYDKTTNATTTNYAATWALGGIGQGTVQSGAGVGIAVRGALGLIWGHLPDAIFLQGTAIGVGGSLAAVAGLGFKAAILFNSSKGAHDGSAQTTNVIAMATYDLGAQVDATVEIMIFYFLSQSQVEEFLSSTSINTYSGTYTFNSADL